LTKEKIKKTMKELVEELGANIVPLKVGSTLEVTIISKTNSRITVNVNDVCQGIIPEKEFSTEVFDLKPGDKIVAYLLNLENDEGFAVLSLRRADKERIWQNLDEKLKAGDKLKVKIKEANKGGLIAQYGSIEGFIPLSQLNQKYIIDKNDPSLIINSLRKLTDKIMEVKVISIDKANNKLIFSEKEVNQAMMAEKIKKIYQIGNKIKGKITAIVPFGIFVNLGEIEGLVHISEISWDRVNDIKKLFKVGDEIESEIIDLDNGKVSLSLKRLEADPWLKAVEKYKTGEEIKGKVTRITPFGAFIELDDKVTGLVHISELAAGSHEKIQPKIDEILELGKIYNFKIVDIKPEVHRVSLSLLEEKAKPKETKPKKASKKLTKN